MSYSKLKIKEKLLVIVLTVAMLLPMTAVNVDVAVAATDTCPYLTSADIKDMASAKLDIIYGGVKK